MRVITIGDRELKEINPNELLKGAQIEGHMPDERFWSNPEIEHFDPVTFNHRTIVIDYSCSRIQDGCDIMNKD